MSDTRTDAAIIASTAQGKGAQLRRMIERLLLRHRIAQRLFLGDDGKPTPPAAEWLRWLAREAHVETSTYDGDRDRMLINEGERKLALKILRSIHLDTERLGALTRMERENERD